MRGREEFFITDGYLSVKKAGNQMGKRVTGKGKGN